MATIKSGTFTPIDWDKITSVPSHSITGINASAITANTITYNMPGSLLDYNMEYDMDWLAAAQMPQHEMELMFKKELAQKLAEKMIADGHIVFTKQNFNERHVVRFKAYTWVGNKEFIEQQRKNNR